MKAWHNLTERSILTELQTDQQFGLSEQEARARLVNYGPNELHGHKQDSLLKRFLNQMKDPMIIVLLVAAVLSFVSSGFND